jgi:UDP-GlcNAc:undecaprenyl-phosphate/decaprenyl-phosphate GlcNAc-1-phosphate transferase
LVYNEDGDLMETSILNMIKIVFTTFLFVFLITPYIIKIANHIGAVDIPEERKIHKKPTPRLGGLGVFFGFLFGYVLFGTPSTIINSILIGSFIIVITGVVDDIKPLKPNTKFLGQLVASLVIVYYGGLLINGIGLLEYYISFGYLAYPITMFFILGCINSINLIDGIDGLSSGIASIYFLTVAIIAYIKVKTGLDMVLTLIMLGSTLGFLVHNFHPAKIFLGDSGSMLMGFMISVISLLGFKSVTLTSLFIPILLLAIPILDTLLAILRRLIKKQNITKPDKLHIHHQFLNRNFSIVKTVLIIYAINILFAIASIVYVINEKELGYLIYGILFIVVFLFILKTNVLIEPKKRKKLW